MKKVLALFMTFVIFAVSFSFSLSALAVQNSSIPKTRIASSDTYYSYDYNEKRLTISGSGAVPNMKNTTSSQPWFDWRSDGSIKSVVIEEGITSIGDYCLYQVCADSISLPSTLTKIGNYSFAYNTAVSNISIPFGVQLIGANAFENCSALVEISLPDSLLVISKNAFKQCYSLENIEIPYSVQSLGNYCFYRCSALCEVTFQSMSNAVLIGSYAFYSCPKLLTLAVPLNATLSSYSFGYNESKQKYSGISMQVFSGSDGMTYAKTKSIPYTLISSIELECGVVNTNEFVEETTGYTYTYTFIPSSTQVYNIYSLGSTDVKAVLSASSEIIAESDDIEQDNLNFCLSEKLEAGEEYTITVNSVKSTGEYSVVVYPDIINGFEIKGSLLFNAEDGIIVNSSRYFEISEDMLSEFVLNIRFNDGFEDKIYFKAGYFDNREIEFFDNQNSSPFTCGENLAYVSVGDLANSYSVYIEHSFREEVIAPTVDDDGYTLYTCILCGDSYKDNFVETTAVTVSGKAVLMEHPNGAHSHNIPYSNATFFANNRTYYIDENGNWSVNTFDDLDLVFENEYGENISVHIDVEDEDVEYGTIAFNGYDFNKDGYINAKDFAIFLKEKKSSLGEGYWDYAVNFI